ncbi:MAG: molybdopterin-dependent oxidoreductase [Dehalococcoidia bacterium]|nr:molybdopterin-dependent oxidoreductase [Dehalococcoidia bacterium]
MSTPVAGKSVPRRDLLPKLTGEAKYTADLDLPGLLYAAVLRSPHPHADVLSVDTAGARGLPGVHAVVTPFDAPKGMVDVDLPILDTRVRFVGDEVAAVAAEDPETAREAAGILQVRYRELPFVLEAKDALKEGAPAIHAGGNLVGGEPLVLQRGDVNAGFGESDLTVEGDYFVPVHSATPLEPRAATARWDGDDLTVWKSSRGVHVDRAALAKALDMDPERVRVVGPYLGGGFGNKDESRMAALAALLAGRAGRPVRLEYSREEEFVAGRTRHAAHIGMRVGVKRDGTITAIDTRATIDTGAYLASGQGVARRLGQGPLYLYHCPNVRYEAHLAYTNRPVAGSYRALGAPQGHFALECLMDRAAEELGMDPLEFRIRNHVRLEGQPGHRTTPTGQIVDSQPVEGGIPFSSNGLDECLRMGADAFDWAGRQTRRETGDPSVKRGFGVSMMLYRGGPGFHAAAEVRLHRSGRIRLATGLIDVGEGLTTVLCQLAAEALGARYEDIEPVLADTSGTPDSPITAGSTATFSTGTAVVSAARRARRALLELASLGLESPVDELEAAEGHIFVKGDPHRRMSMQEAAGLMEGETTVIDEVLTPGSTDYIVNSFGAHFAEVEVDTDLGRVRVVKYVAAHDSGRILNPRLALNQAEGAISQMLGFALTEELVTDGPTGVTLNASYLEHKSPTILDYPDIRVIFADVTDPVGPMGAKALGEPPCVGVAPAIANAVYDAIGVRPTRLPLTPDVVLEAIQRRRASERGP